MSSLAGFIVLIILVTICFTIFAHNKLKEPFSSDDSFLTSSYSSIDKNYKQNFWFNAELTNGRLAMIGFIALILNYKIFGLIILGIV
tara:strand:- start:471 stop:731 length:261 start_codon:yes stop_codon:yes gene_type:complete